MDGVDKVFDIQTFTPEEYFQKKRIDRQYKKDDNRNLPHDIIIERGSCFLRNFNHFFC